MFLHQMSTLPDYKLDPPDDSYDEDDSCGNTWTYKYDPNCTCSECTQAREDFFMPYDPQHEPQFIRSKHDCQCSLCFILTYLQQSNSRRTGAFNV